MGTRSYARQTPRRIPNIDFSNRSNQPDIATGEWYGAQCAGTNELGDVNLDVSILGMRTLEAELRSQQ